MFKRNLVIQEDYKDCGPACLAMIIKHYKGNVNIFKLKELCKTNKNGTNAYNLIEASKKCGFEAYGIRCNVNEFNKNMILPCIAHVVIDNSYTHYVVIYKVDNKVHVKDPIGKIKKYSFEEFEKIINQVIYVSATPGDYELEHVNNEVVEQIIRPTGLLDPKIEVRPTANQIDDIISEIKMRQEKNERVLITTLTKRMAEDLSAYLKELGIKVAYLHSDTKTLERTEILRDLRIGKYDVLVGINLLREGLDLPEVSLVCILDCR